MQKYVLGMDGGGTKTHCALFDTSGNKVDLIDWGPTNHEVLKGGLVELQSQLKEIIKHVLEKNNISLNQLEKCVFGLAGVDTKEQHIQISKIIEAIGIKKFILSNDAYLGVKAGSPQGKGICVINGTGCCVAGIDSKGKMFQIGGQGHLTGDIGGGSGIGEMAVQAVYNHLFRCGEYTQLKELLFEVLEVESKYEFLDNLTGKIEQGTLRMADLNKMVFKAANSGDAKAIEILAKVGHSGAASVNGMLKELDFLIEDEVSIILGGSINLKGDNPTLINTLTEEINSKNKSRNIKIIKVDKEPVMGAVIWALEDFLSREEIVRRFFINN